MIGVGCLPGHYRNGAADQEKTKCESYVGSVGSEHNIFLYVLQRKRAVDLIIVLQENLEGDGGFRQQDRNYPYVRRIKIPSCVDMDSDIGQPETERSGDCEQKSQSRLFYSREQLSADSLIAATVILVGYADGTFLCSVSTIMAISSRRSS